MLQVHGGYGYIAEYPIEQLYRDERVQRIYEGTNEINRILIPGLLLRKGIGGRGVEPAFTAAIGSFVPEKQLLQGMKRTYLALADRIVARFGAAIASEQEILLALADVAIQIFALESAVLRAEKAAAAATEQRREEYRAIAILCAFTAKQRFVEAVDRCAAYIGEVPSSAAVAAVTAYRPDGLLPAQRLIAAAVSQAERYIF
jgi:alkylation response protein AidB-like acyl-CoA dehydrogenase